MGIEHSISMVMQSVTKYMAKSKEIKQNWTRSENFDISLCVNFDRYFQKLNFKGDTGH